MGPLAVSHHCDTGGMGHDLSQATLTWHTQSVCAICPGEILSGPLEVDLYWRSISVKVSTTLQDSLLTLRRIPQIHFH